MTIKRTPKKEAGYQHYARLMRRINPAWGTRSRTKNPVSLKRLLDILDNTTAQLISMDSSGSMYATRRLNAEQPTGLAHNWMLHDAPFRTGEDNPCPCDKAPETHKHMLFSC